MNVEDNKLKYGNGNLEKLKIQEETFETFGPRGEGEEEVFCFLEKMQQK